MNPGRSKTLGEWIGLAFVALLLGGCARQPTAPEPGGRPGAVSLPSTRSILASQEAKLTASDAMPEDLFGYSVALSGDLALVGSLGEVDNGMFSGASYVFRGSGAGWTEEAIIATPGAEGSEDFDIAVALDGDVAVISSQGDDQKGNFAGAALVFRRSGGAWTQEAKLTASDGEFADFLGSSVALEGEVVVVGAEGDRFNDTSSGAAYVFRRVGGVWTEEAKLIASDRAPLQAFGQAVALSGDVVLVGARGSAYVFRRFGGSWTEEAKLVAWDGVPSPPDLDLFGWAVAVKGDLAVVGAPNNGLAYVFRHTAGAWTQQTTLSAFDAGPNDFFGASIALDEEIAVIGVPDADGATMTTGAAYVFGHREGAWTQEAKLVALDGMRFSLFGWAVSMSQDRVLVGAPLDVRGVRAGAAYVFELRSVHVVSIDVMPGSKRNPINPDPPGTVPVAILSDGDLAAPAAVDRATLTFGASGEEESLQLRGNGTPNCGVVDVNGDGRDDLLCHFLNAVAGFSAADTEAVLRGELVDGTPIEGRDTVTPVGRLARFGRAAGEERQLR